MSLIQINNLTFAYEGSYDAIFENVSFQFDTDWKLGFTGRNGRGKTTFLHLLMGDFSYKGNISSHVSFEYFPYEVSDSNMFTIDIVKEITPSIMDWEIYKEFSILQINEDVLYRPFSTLSKGEQTKALLAALFLKENSFLLIDEPTNHLDHAARKKLGEYLNKKKGFLLVSHDRTLLDQCTDHILAINKTNIEVQKGNFSSWWENKTRQDLYEQAENERHKKEIKRLTAAARQSSQWSSNVEKTKYNTFSGGLKLDRGYVGHKAAKMMQRSKNLEKRQQTLIEEKSKLLKNLETSESLKLNPLKFHTDCLVRVKDLSVFYDERQICRNITFEIHQGQRIALQGKNGSGKSSILKILLGQNISHSGTLETNQNMIISYVSQDTAHLTGSLNDYIREYHIDESLFKALLRKLDFSREQFEKPLNDYSAGQKKKVLLARGSVNYSV